LRAEQDKKLAMKKRAEEIRKQREYEEKKQRDAEAKRRRIEEAEKKKQAMLKAEQDRNTGRNFVIGGSFGTKGVSPKEHTF
jgi:troponin T